MKTLLLLATLCSSIFLCAQNNTFPYPQNGNIGIRTTNPLAPLDVNGKIITHRVFSHNPNLIDGSTFSNSDQRNEEAGLIVAGRDNANTNLFSFFDFPQSNLNSKSEVWLNVDDRNNATRLRLTAQAAGDMNFRLYNRFQTPVFHVSEQSNLAQLIMPLEASYVMIGTNTYQDSGDIYHLSVNGKIRANSVKVYTDWADFVFEDDYNLPTLPEIKKYIEDYGHLENIPSAREVEKNGIDLGNMNKLLLQKIEELTLILIDKNEDIEMIKSVLMQQKDKINELENSLNLRK